jgi:hypothetical protein
VRQQIAGDHIESCDYRVLTVPNLNARLSRKTLGTAYMTIAPHEDYVLLVCVDADTAQL